MYMTDIAVEVMSGSLIGLPGYLGACRLAGGMLEARARAADVMTPIESYTMSLESESRQLGGQLEAGHFRRLTLVKSRP